MRTPQEREKIVKDLVNTFNDRDELHIAYKTKMKQIITYAIMEFTNFVDESPDITDEDIAKWICNFVEERFKLQ